MGGGGVQSVKFYNIWEGVLLSENLGWGGGDTEGSRGFKGVDFALLKDGEKEYKVNDTVLTFDCSRDSSCNIHHEK